VRFRRGRALRTLQPPARGGTVDLLREVIPISADDDWHLIVGWLVGALRPRGPYTNLALDGEHGSGKSTAARMLRRLIDPSEAELRAEPREIRDLMVAAAGGWIVALDNLSHIQPWLSDALCRISTGGALSTRTLYTDDEEHIIEAVRPVILTGIAAVISRGDLQDRGIPITLAAIPEERRLTEDELWRAYEGIQPRVLGALLEATACALRQEQEIRLRCLPRMADWARWATAAEPALGWPAQTILTAYRVRSQDAIEWALEGDPVASEIRKLALPWTGTSGDLLARITPVDPKAKEWPRTPRALSAILRRLAPQLRRVGIDVHLPEGARNARERIIQLQTRGSDQDTQDAPDIARSSGVVGGECCSSGLSCCAPLVSPYGRDNAGGSC
jgi:hypothetical protein